MINFLIMNPHFIPFLLSFFIGAVFLLLAPFHYRARTKSTKLMLTPFDLWKYDKKEKKYLKWGIGLVLFGIFGLVIVDSKYGHNIKVFNVDGTFKIEKNYTGSRNMNADYLDSK